MLDRVDDFDLLARKRVRVCVLLCVIMSCCYALLSHLFTHLAHLIISRIKPIT